MKNSFKRRKSFGSNLSLSDVAVVGKPCSTLRSPTAPDGPALRKEEPCASVVRDWEEPWVVSCVMSSITCVPACPPTLLQEWIWVGLLSWQARGVAWD
jgi:hypothetical protein